MVWRASPPSSIWAPQRGAIAIVQHNSALDTLPENERIAYKAGHWDHAWSISDVLRFPTPVAVGVSSQTWAAVPTK
jgi:hypothetical protein